MCSLETGILEVLQQLLITLTCLESFLLYFILLLESLNKVTVKEDKRGKSLSANINQKMENDPNFLLKLN